ncbi:flavonol 3-sulfotransferase-like [Coffea arabica]|uniref:Sulfotransferase n=1 Tax=Coffea arabica TaxID=13443 RepID=A0A6P6TVK2_COFAR|nr:flavonol 3-sulfotransferase-like [Coffea arabica]
MEETPVFAPSSSTKATVLRSTIFFQRNFKAKDRDVILASMPKSGTTCLKSLSFSIINRKKNSILKGPRLTTNPHELVRFLESAKALPIDEAFELFCKGICPLGPFWDHAEGYWNASLNDVQKVLFLKYEDLKIDATSHVKKLAEFLGFPFSPEEDENGVVEEIVRLCSLENLRNLEGNKNGGVNTPATKFKASSFFRKGKVGDWTNFVIHSMAERYKKIMEEKLGNVAYHLNCSNG